MTDLSHNFEGEQQHPPQDDFLLYVDGELSPKETEKWELHLDACWSCRVRVAKIEETITEIVEFENAVSQFQQSRMPTIWGNFNSRLNDIATEVHPRSFSDRIHDLWKHTEYFGLFRIAVPSLAALLIVAIVYQFIAPTTVSASELLRLSAETQAEKISGTVQPVLHQRIQVTQRSNSGVTPATWEIWNDTVNSRVKISSQSVQPTVAGGDLVRTGNGSDRGLSDGVVVSDLRTILKANNMNEHRPLSAASYQAWTGSLIGKTEEVIRHNDTLTIHTLPTAGQITEARFSVRESDYHPTSLYINVKTAEGGYEFELIEQSYEVVSLKDVDPSIFGDPTKVEIASTVGTIAKAESPINTNENTNTEIANTNANLSPNVPKATTADEVEVLNRLHQIGADITEQLNVTRTADGRLLVEGLVETDTRKQEILNALAPVRNNPAIRIKIQTLEEATKALQRQKAQATPGTVERVEVEKGKLAVDAELRSHFEKSGGDPDEKIRAFISRVTSRAKGAAFQASALNRMANRFNAEQLAALDPAARSKYLGMLKGYAAAVRRETAALRGELQPVFGDVPSNGAASGESVTSDADLIASARRLFELASQNDRVIRSAFTISSGGASVSGVRSAQFRRSLGQAEALAAAIERAR